MSKILTVWKFRLQLVGDTQKLSIPKGSEHLHTDVQDGRICMWFLVDTDRKNYDRYFRVYGTGYNVLRSSIKQHMGTVLDGEFVWHIFEVAQ